jgi:hypothetical protein
LHNKIVIPGRREAANPEPIFQRPVFMGSGFVAFWPRPGMTHLCEPPMRERVPNAARRVRAIRLVGLDKAGR